MTDHKVNCPQCGKLFTSWRGKRFCSEVCRKRDENKRRRAIDDARGEAAPPLTGFPRKDAIRALRGDETALVEPLAELAAGFTRIALMLNPTIEAIRHELTGWNIKDERTIRIIAWRMRVAPTAVREALNG
jgi:hypothetical protein